MSLEQNYNIETQKNIDDCVNDIATNFSFQPLESKNNSGVALSTSDSAYNSLVCSPFSPVVLYKSNETTSSTFQDNFPITQGSTSSFSENDEVFKISFEQIPSSSMTNATFRPIAMGQSNSRFDYQTGRSSNDVQIRESNRKCCMTSKRSISTQTKFSMSSNAMYRPNSAPLQEDVEEELDEINIGGMINTSNRIHRNSTCHCIRSPMPDLIQPTFQNNNQLIASQLSLIADQIDETINPRAISLAHGRRRRFSTSIMTDLAPGGSVFDFLCSICNAFDSTLPRRWSNRSPIND